MGCFSEAGKKSTVEGLGLIGDGKKDNTLALQKAFDTQSEIDLGNGIYRISKNVKIRRNNIFVKGENAQILFDGTHAERLLWIEASNIRFEGITFNGNNKQVKGSLLYIAENSQKVSFTNCQFLNIKGTHQGVKSHYSNAQYAVMVNPRQVDCTFDNCQFKNISNDNSGKYLPAYVGGGFAGAVFFCNHDFKESSVISTQGTKCDINNCTFDNIKTVLAEKLPLAKQVNLNDADAIRTYAVKSAPLDLTVMNSQFINVSKRAVKFSRTVGGLIKDCSVRTDKLKYPMATAFKLSENNTIENINIQGSSNKPIGMAFQIHNAKNISIKNITINHCNMLLNSAPDVKNGTISNVILNNIKCENCHGGIINSTFAEKVEKVRITNIEVLNTSSKKFLGFENIIASKANNENYFQNITIENGYMKLGGYNNTIKDIVISINDNATKETFANNRCVFEGFGAKNDNNSLSGLEVNISKIPKEYFKNRKAILLLYGNNAKYSNLVLNIESENLTPECHISIAGNNQEIDGVSYKGGGSIQIGTSSNLSLSDFTRKKIKSRSLPAFIQVENAENLTLDKVTDLAIGNKPTVDCIKVKNCQITDVKSSSVNSEIINKRGNKIITKKIESIIKER